MSTTATNPSRKYELMVILSGELTPEATEQALSELRQMLKESNGDIFHEDNWGKRPLAYRVKRQRYGVYVVFDFHLPGEKVLEIRNDIKINPHVLRYNILSLPEDYAPKKYVLEEEKKVPYMKRKRMKKEEVAFEVPAAPPTIREVKEEKPAPALTGEEAKKELEKVEEKLEEILKNPDIDIK